MKDKLDKLQEKILKSTLQLEKYLYIRDELILKDISTFSLDIKIDNLKNEQFLLFLEFLSFVRKI
ncbi:MAG: hypothetical protein QM482_09115 [Sulfurospirillum sp.]